MSDIGVVFGLKLSNGNSGQQASYWAQIKVED